MRRIGFDAWTTYCNSRTRGFQGQRSSALGRVRIVAVAVALADATVLAMNQDLTTLVDGDVTGSPLGLGLGTVMRGVTLVVFATHGPAVVALDYMLVFACHFKILSRLGGCWK